MTNLQCIPRLYVQYPLSWLLTDLILPYWTRQWHVEWEIKVSIGHERRRVLLMSRQVSFSCHCLRSSGGCQAVVDLFAPFHGLVLVLALIIIINAMVWSFRSLRNVSSFDCPWRTYEWTSEPIDLIVVVLCGTY